MVATIVADEKLTFRFLPEDLEKHGTINILYPSGEFVGSIRFIKRAGNEIWYRWTLPEGTLCQEYIGSCKLPSEIRSA